MNKCEELPSLSVNVYMGLFRKVSVWYSIWLYSLYINRSNDRCVTHEGAIKPQGTEQSSMFIVAIKYIDCDCAYRYRDCVKKY